MTLEDLRALATGERDGYRVWEGDLGKMAVTLEDAEFLYALVRLVKPQLIFELGTGLGISARFMVEAQQANGFGKLATVEPDHGYAARARDLLDRFPALVSTTLPPGTPDLVFIDSGWAHRGRDIEEWLGNGYQGLVVVHDANRDYPGLAAGTGVFLPGTDGLWIGRATA